MNREESVDTSNNVPRWLEKLLHERIIDPCSTHNSFLRNEKTRFCLECSLSFCFYCVHNPEHHFLQIRRCKGEEVVKKADMEKLIDCSCVQPFSVNRALVVFLKARTQARPARNLSNSCVCKRALDQDFGFCSIACKVKVNVSRGDSLGMHDEDFSRQPTFNGISGGITTSHPHDSNNKMESSSKKSKHRRKGIPVRAPLQ